MKNHLHMAIGPVQAFVIQSRRTRDLWGSSFLLSFLAAHAMKGARAAGGAVVRPDVGDDPLLRWVEGRQTAGEAPPRLGSLPNQFLVDLGEHDAQRVAAAAVAALQAAWRRVCDAVWERFVAGPAALGDGTREIWDRQVAAFWEVAWAAGPADQEDLLTRRKLWRTHRLPAEPGRKCSIMPDFQELSGLAASAAAQEMWGRIAAGKYRHELDGERLSAIALVKRFYVHVSEAAIGWTIDTARWPSTIDVAAGPWVRKARMALEAADYAQLVRQATGNEASTGGASLLLGVMAGSPDFARLNANFFHPTYLAGRELQERWPGADPKRLDQELKALAAAPDDAGQPLGTPPIYYALLLADGDSLGTLVEVLGGDTVSQALARFTGEVPGIVGAALGITVYAGGDDVLALLPVEGALACAHRLEEAYRSAFPAAGPTLSAAVVFAHGREPLDGVLSEAHRLLDGAAKRRNGRDSLAVAIYRRATTTTSWVTTWRRPAATADRVQQAGDLVEQVAARLDRARGGPLSSSLFHDLRHLLGLVCGPASPAPYSFAELGEGLDLEPLVRAEIRHRLAFRETAIAPEALDELTREIGDLLPRSHNPAKEDDARHIGLDGFTVAAFLAGGGREEDHA